MHHWFNLFEPATVIHSWTPCSQLPSRVEWPIHHSSVKPLPPSLTIKSITINNHYHPLSKLSTHQKHVQCTTYHHHLFIAMNRYPPNINQRFTMAFHHQWPSSNHGWPSMNHQATMAITDGLKHHEHHQTMSYGHGDKLYIAHVFG